MVARKVATAYRNRQTSRRLYQQYFTLLSSLHIDLWRHVSDSDRYFYLAGPGYSAPSLHACAAIRLKIITDTYRLRLINSGCSYPLSLTKQPTPTLPLSNPFTHPRSPSYIQSIPPNMADVEMQDASSAKDKPAKTSKNAAGEASEGKKRFEVKKVNTALP